MGTVPSILDTFPHWVAIDMAWNKKYLDLFSPVASAMRVPISEMNFLPMGPQDPMATRMTVIGHIMKWPFQLLDFITLIIFEGLGV